MKKLVALFLSLLLLTVAFAVYAENPVSIKIDVTFGQTEARSMLEMINEFRASNAKCWNEDNTVEEEYSGLEPLVYDYELEKAAMQRAAELAVYYAHQRPDNTDCITAFPSSCTYKGENIAAGLGRLETAQEAYMAWREDDKPYSGQGHRRNMLYGNFNCIGIGHVIYDGKHYWAQSLAKRTSPVTTATTAVNSKQTVTVEIDPELVTGAFTENKTMDIGQTTDLPGVSFAMSKTWPSGDIVVYSPTDAALKPIWTVSDPAKLSIGDTSMTALGAGEILLTTTVLGKDISSTVTINPIDIANATLTISAADLVYTGSAQTPAVVVTDGDKALVQDTDYAVAYTDNVNASDHAKVTITGTGNYFGTKEETFTIGLAPLTITANDKTITYGDTPANDGVNYAGFVGSEDSSALGGTLSYTYSYAQFGDVGSNYTITPAGLTSSNYAITFAEGTLTVDQKEVGLSWSNTTLTYNGDEQAPTAEITGAVNGDVITAVVTGAQTDAGTYTATVTGLSGTKAANYKLPSVTETSFVINKAVPVVTAPTAKTNLICTGSAQELVTAGSTTGGTIKYSLEENGTYTSAVPSAVDAGTYTVWYKVEGGTNYEDVAPQSITVIIKKLCTITFDANGGTGTMTAVTKAEGETYVLPVCDFTAPDCQVFNGWQIGTDTAMKAAGDSITVTDDITVKAVWKDIAVTGVSLDKTAVTLKVGDTLTLTATVAPENAANREVMWTTDDAGIAAIDNGVVTAVAAGTATITVTTKDGGKTASCTVTVENIPTPTPTAKPTVTPTTKPTVTPTAKPTVTPTAKPEDKPTATPTTTPEGKPTVSPTPTPGDDATPTPGDDVTPTPVPAVYTVTVTSDGNGTASADPDSGIEGTEVTLTAVPNDGYRFKEWLILAGNVTVTENKFIIGTADVEIQAVFELIPIQKHFLTINYVFADGTKAADAYMAELKEGEDYTVPSPVLDGYKADKPTVEGTMGTEDVTETVTYTSTIVDEVTVNGGVYTLNHEKKTATLRKAQKTNATKLKVNSTVKANGKKYKVTAVADGACKGMKKLASLVIGANVKTLGKNAFADCPALKTVKGGVKLTSIGVNAFANCPSLTSVATLKQLTKISDGAFQKTGLKKFTLGAKLTTIGKNAFANCTKLTKIEGGKALTTIEAGAFTGDTKLTTVPVLAKLTTIGDSAFNGCKALTKITLSAKVTTVGKNAFANCTAMKTVAGGKAVTKIGAGAFSGCAGLTTLPVFEKLETIGDSAFKGCKAITKITLCEKVKSIGKSAFNGCAKLKTIVIKTKLLKDKNVGAGAFKGISNKATVTCPKGMVKTYKKLLLKKGMPKTTVFK